MSSQPTSTPTLTITPSAELSVTPTEETIGVTTLPTTGDDKIEITILGPDGEPLVNTVVKIDGKNLKTDENGQIVIGGLTSGEHEVTYTIDGVVYTKSLVLGESTEKSAVTVSFVPEIEPYDYTFIIMLVVLIAASVVVYFVVIKKKTNNESRTKTTE